MGPETNNERPAAASVCRLSIVIPAFNEARRLPAYLPAVAAFAATVEGGGEVLVVDDGSQDDTVAYVRAVAEANPGVRLLQLASNTGKGGAVRHGLAAARGELMLFTDADGSTPIAEAPKLLALAAAGADLAIGTRRGPGQAAHRTWWRSLLGGIFWRVTRLIGIPAVSDTQCGFKLLTRACVRRLLPHLRENGWAFDVELLYLAGLMHLRISETPVVWQAIKGSKVQPVRDALRMLGALVRIRRHAASGFPD